jgi:hypothetical protein
MKNNVIEMRKFREIDPIIRKGDFVRLKKMEEFFDENLDIANELYDQELEPEDLEGVVGVVSGIELTLPVDHYSAPGQSMFVTVAVPFDEEHWCEIQGVSIYHLSRVIGRDFV